MVEGEADIHATSWGAFVAGFSWQKLFFRPKGAKEEEEIEILDPYDDSRAYRCTKCGAVLVEKLP